MSNPRRKHRVVVEITLDEPCTAKHARTVVEDMLDAAEYAPTSRKLGWGASCMPKAKEYSRVKRADNAKAKQPA